MSSNLTQLRQLYELSSGKAEGESPFADLAELSNDIYAQLRETYADDDVLEARIAAGQPLPVAA